MSIIKRFVIRVSNLRKYTFIFKKNLRLKRVEEVFHTYRNPDLIEVIIKKNVELKVKLEQNKFVLTLNYFKPLLGFLLLSKKDFITVIDFGGQGGLHYFVARKLISENIKLDWRVVETDEMVRQARIISENELTFHSTVKSAMSLGKDIDYVFSNSALQYTTSPFISLQELINIDAPILLITGVTLRKSAKKIRILQESRLKDNGPGPLPLNFTDCEIIYPIVIENFHEFRNKITLGYKIIQEIVEPGIHYYHGENFNDYGFLCQRLG
jgi:putative methyltransferase (TIGR04325 family)